ncbi:MAG TPA: hypothetical protein VD790_11425 [Thermoleophilaceae bacterium]|nr:hypothetical protein [Thermoleophilaceae bacterium]
MISSIRISVVVLALSFAVTVPAPAAADHGGPYHFTSEKHARKEIKRLVRRTARKDGRNLQRMKLEYCRYGQTKVWQDWRWLCDLYIKVDGDLYCGYGRMTKKPGRDRVEFNVARWRC